MKKQTEPDFIQHMRAFSHAVRCPDEAKTNFDAEKLKTYQHLVFDNIASILAAAFPVLHKILAAKLWQYLIQNFICQHHCKSPIFYEIPQEFITYLQHECDLSIAPPFLLELAHYEYMELALELAKGPTPIISFDPNGDLLTNIPVVSGLAWLLQYQFPVHKIGVDYLPEKPGDEPTFIIIYRKRDDVIEFLHVNAVTAKLMLLLQSARKLTGQQALQAIAVEMQHPNPQTVFDNGKKILHDLHEVGIIVGSECSL